jgi:hypothetical protein
MFAAMDLGDPSDVKVKWNEATEEYELWIDNDTEDAVCLSAPNRADLIALGRAIVAVAEAAPEQVRLCDDCRAKAEKD